MAQQTFLQIRVELARVTEYGQLCCRVKPTGCVRMLKNKKRREKFWKAKILSLILASQYLSLSNFNVQL
jgi:hypothetical protein